MRHVDIRAAVDQKWHAELVQQRDTLVVRPRRMHDDRIDPLAFHQAPIELHLVVMIGIGHGNDENVGVLGQQPLGHPRHEFGEVKLACPPHHHADRACPSGLQPDGIDVRPVAEPNGLLRHARAGHFAHFGIAAQRAADGRRRQSELFCELSKLHAPTRLSSPAIGPLTHPISQSVDIWHKNRTSAKPISMFNRNRHTAANVLHIRAASHSVVFTEKIAAPGKSKPRPNYPLDLISRF